MHFPIARRAELGALNRLGGRRFTGYCMAPALRCAGELHVEETERMVRKGAEVLGGGRLVVGLFGGAGLIAAYPRSSADAVDNSVTRPLKKVVGEVDGKKVDLLKRAPAKRGCRMKQPAQ